MQYNCKNALVRCFLWYQQMPSQWIHSHMAYRFIKCNHHQIGRLMVFIQILIISNDPHKQLLSGLPPPPIAKGRFQHTPSVDEHLTAVVTKSSLWLLSSSDGEGWHFNLRVWLTQCGGQYLPHPHGSTCEGRTLAHRNVWFTPSHIQLNDKSNKKGSDKYICYVSNRQAAMLFQICLWFKVCRNAVGFCMVN